ncbi:MAG: hypothetical protein AAF633_04160 [Chloroflexota bacterium]
MRQQTPRPFALWLISNCIGGAIAGLAEARFSFLGTFVLVGFIIGIAQTIPLLFIERGAWMWAVITAIAWPIAGYLELGPLSLLSESLVTFLTNSGLLWELIWINSVRLFFVLGLVGAAQTLYLSRLFGSNGRNQAGLWILLSALGGAAIGATGTTVCRFACDAVNGWILTGLMLGISQWLVYGLITGIIFLRANDPPQPHNS